MAPVASTERAGPLLRLWGSGWAAPQADPLTCGKCGGQLQIVAYISDHFTIKKILDHLGLSPPEIERPPPEIRYVPVDDEGCELKGMVAEGLHSPSPGGGKG